ncbi:MAG: SRPBCC family protein [Planctomycetes bacterium]|nr:SRPBCC family protein [Planctomycetota bacterium]
MERVAPFFERPENLEAITPPFLNFSIRTPSPVPMHDGAIIDYVVRLHGLPMRWRTRIEGFVPGRAFTDVALRSPYAYWIHRHEFEPVGPGRTRVRDRVEYAPPLLPMSRPVHALFVRPTLERIFAFRRARVRALVDGSGARA